MELYDPAIKIVAILHEHKITLSNIDEVFSVAKAYIENNTIVYNPNAFKVNDLAISVITEKVTDSSG